MQFLYDFYWYLTLLAGLGMAAGVLGLVLDLTYESRMERKAEAFAERVSEIFSERPLTPRPLGE
jgi:hypothetical protein